MLDLDKNVNKNPSERNTRGRIDGFFFIINYLVGLERGIITGTETHHQLEKVTRDQARQRNRKCLFKKGKFAFPFIAKEGPLFPSFLSSDFFLTFCLKKLGNMCVERSQDLGTNFTQ